MICYWIHVEDETPWNRWWPAFLKDQPKLSRYSVEKWDGHSAGVTPLLDSLRSLSLFGSHKALVIQSAHRFLEKTKSAELFSDALKNSPHALIFCSPHPAPKKFQGTEWRGPNLSVEVDEKSIFRWTDAILAGQHRQALIELDEALQHQHALGCLQVLTKGYRSGRLIHHALDKGLTESEITTRLRVHPFIFQKWKKRKTWSTRQWLKIFERCHRADLDLKSGHDPHWVMRKLSYDLIEMDSGRQEKSSSFSRGAKWITSSPSLFSTRLLRPLPSFS